MYFPSYTIFQLLSLLLSSQAVCMIRLACVLLLTGPMKVNYVAMQAHVFSTELQIVQALTMQMRYIAFLRDCTLMW